MGLLGDMFKKKPRILLADDDPSVRALVADVLATQDYEVVAAEDGVAALALFQKGKYDLLILDVHMPRLEGPELLEAIRALPGGKEQPVMMLTSEKLTGTINKVFELHAVDYMFKPFGVKDLLVKVNAQLASKKNAP